MFRKLKNSHYSKICAYLRNFSHAQSFFFNVALPPKSPLLSPSGFYFLPLGKVNKFPLLSLAASFQEGDLVASSRLQHQLILYLYITLTGSSKTPSYDSTRELSAKLYTYRLPLCSVLRVGLYVTT